MGSPGVTKAAQKLLAFPKRVAKEHRCLFIVQSFTTESDYTFDDLLGWRKLIMGTAISGLHDQDIRVAWFAFFRGKAWPQFEIAGVEERFMASFDPGHGAAENVACGQKGNITRLFPAGEVPRLWKGRTCSNHSPVRRARMSCEVGWLTMISR